MQPVIFEISQVSSLLQTGELLISHALPSSHKTYSPSRDVSDAREFSMCFICPAENVGFVVGICDSFINQIRQESTMTITINTSETDEKMVLVYFSCHYRRSIPNCKCSNKLTYSMQ